MSSGHSCKEGRTISNSHSRWYRSSLNRFSCIASWRSSLVAATILTLARFSLLPPIGNVCAFLQNPQQHGLDVQGQDPYFIQKECSAFCHFKISVLVGVGTGKCSLYVPEKEGGCKLLGYDSTIHGDKRHILPLSYIVDTLCNRFFSGTVRTKYCLLYTSPSPRDCS